MWKYYALLSAFFAALTAILAKLGLREVGGNIATAIRTIVILFLAWGIVIARGQIRDVGEISRSSLLFLVASGLTTGLSWVFYFKAMETGNVSHVAAIDKLSLAITIGLAALFLKETVDLTTILGAAMIVVGTFVIAQH
ncbi:MAG: EamA family transporter [Leptospirales bacterium]|nr:EamA family transporter [Leptospirales bacterium]